MLSPTAERRISMANIFLFDIDGVLIRPGGYRAAVKESLRILLERMGFPQNEGLLPQEEDMSLFEAQSISSEWDMVPICLGVILSKLVEQHPDLKLAPDLWEMCDAVRAQGWTDGNYPTSIDYRQAILQVGARRQVGVPPAESALSLALDPALYFLPGLSQQPALLRNLFSCTRQVTDAPTTRLFQQVSLGSDIFRQSYGIEPEIESISLLETYDEPLMTGEWQAWIKQRQQNGELQAVAYTARPSIPPIPGVNHPGGYSPEAELALRRAGLEGIPLVGYGHMEYIARIYGEAPEAFLKPSPVQALAAVFLACGLESLPALHAAVRFYQDGRLPEALDRQNQRTIHVFEDSAGGIGAALQAVELLQKAGFPIEGRAWGIATQPDKIQALQKVCRKVYTDINAVLSDMFGARSGQFND